MALRDHRVEVERETDGLLVAGRCTSCSRVAKVAIRKAPVCIATGHTAGTAATLWLFKKRAKIAKI